MLQNVFQWQILLQQQLYCHHHYIDASKDYATSRQIILEHIQQAIPQLHCRKMLSSH